MNDSSEQNASTRPSTTVAPAPNAGTPANPVSAPGTVKGNEDVTKPAAKPAAPAAAQ